MKETRITRLSRLLNESRKALETKEQILEDLNEQIIKEVDEMEYIIDQINTLSEQIAEEVEPGRSLKRSWHYVPQNTIE